jgi:hypothetical protein
MKVTTIAPWQLIPRSVWTWWYAFPQRLLQHRSELHSDCIKKSAHRWLSHRRLFNSAEDVPQKVLNRAVDVGKLWWSWSTQKVHLIRCSKVYSSLFCFLSRPCTIQPQLALHFTFALSSFISAAWIFHRKRPYKPWNWWYKVRKKPKHLECRSG